MAVKSKRKKKVLMNKFAQLHRDIEPGKGKMQKVGSSFWRGKTDQHPCKMFPFCQDMVQDGSPMRRTLSDCENTQENNTRVLWLQLLQNKQLFLECVLCSSGWKRWEWIYFGVLIIACYCYSTQYFNFYSLYGKMCFCPMCLVLVIVSLRTQENFT